MIDKAGLRIEGEMKVYTHYSPVHGEWQKRRFFELSASENLPDQWQHTVSDGARDKDLVFCFEWWPLKKAATELADKKGAALRF